MKLNYMNIMLTAVVGVGCGLAHVPFLACIVLGMLMGFLAPMFERK